MNAPKFTSAQATPPAFVPAYKNGLKSAKRRRIADHHVSTSRVDVRPWLPDKGLAMIYGTRELARPGLR